MRTCYLIFLFVSLAYVSCQPKTDTGTTTNEQLPDSSKMNYPPELADMKDFPKEWVMLTDLAPDTSYTREYAIMKEPDSTYYGEVNINYVAPDFLMTVRNYLVADVFEIKKCTRKSEAEMVYYDFDLVNRTNKAKEKLQVNFREEPDTHQGSAWFFAQETDLFVSKPFVKNFKVVNSPED